MNITDRRPYASRLAIRFAIILALALLPAGVIAFSQTNALQKEIKARGEAALMGATLQAAMSEVGLIRRLRGVVGSLASAVPFVIDDPDACDALMRNVEKVEQTASVAAFVPLDGIMACSSVDQVLDVNDNPLFQRIIKQAVPTFGVNPKAEISGTSVLGMTHPVRDSAGTYLGYTLITVPHQALAEVRSSALSQGNEMRDPLVFWTFDNTGALLTANMDLADAALHVPSDRPLQDLVGNGDTIFQSTSKAGLPMSYAVVPIVPGELYLMGAFLPAQPGFLQRVGFSAYLPTSLMWLIGLVVAGVAAEYLVTRHVRRLNRSILRFAHGDRRLQAIDLTNAPAELNELASAYLAMTESITHGEAQLEDSLHQKEVLLREVHHRVKNNLQLISSIMNIQIRSAHSVEAKELVRNLQDRIMSLATVHRGLYQTSGLADVRARELIPDIVRQIVAMSSGPEKPFDIQSDIEDLRLVPDQAVPLSLLLAEALTNAIKHAGAARSSPGRLRVRLKRSGGSDAMLEVSNSRRNGHTAPPTRTGIGSQLILAFAQQLGGKLETSIADDDYHLQVTFSVSPLSGAENRQSAPLSDVSGWNATDT